MPQVQAAGSQAVETDAVRRPKVCYVALNIYPTLLNHDRAEVIGGAELQQWLMGRELQQRGYPVSYVTRDYGQGGAEKRDGFQVWGAFRQTDGLPGLRFVYPRVGGIWKALKSADADIYYVRGAGFMLAVVASFARRHGKLCLFCGANDPDFDPAGLRRRLSTRDRLMYQWGLKRCDAVVVQNRTQQRQLRQNFNRDGKLIYSGLPPWQPETTDRTDIVWIARLKPFKRPERFLDLARRLPQQQFVMIGGVTRRSEEQSGWYQEFKRQASQIHNLDFRGFQPLVEVERALDRALLLVNTSQHEGFPNTFLQAWRRGIPVLSFVDPDELISRYQLGQAVQDLDGMESFVRQFVAGESSCEPAAIREVFERRLTIEATVDQYEGLFRSLIL